MKRTVVERLGGETGLFCESPLSLWGRRRSAPVNRRPYRRQLDGEINDAPGYLEGSDMTVWCDHKLTQLSSDHYDVRMRTGDTRVYVRGAASRRAVGVAYADGLAVFKRDFWQETPASLEVCRMNSATAEMRLWFYSPDAEPIDLHERPSQPLLRELPRDAQHPNGVAPIITIRSGPRRGCQDRSSSL